MCLFLERDTMTSEPAPIRTRSRAHLRVVSRDGDVVTLRRPHLPHRHTEHVTVVNATAIFATLYVAVLMLRFLGW